MKEHKHAEVLRAIADGVPLSEFEFRHIAWKDGEWSDNSLTALNHFMINDAHRGNYEFRRKPQYIMVNGFKVPKPLDKDGVELVWVPSLMSEDLTAVWKLQSSRELAIERGIAHATKEAAIAHAKAMLGIDPEAE